MPDPPRLVAVTGSLREGSHTRTAARHAIDAADRMGASAALLDLREFDLPVFDADDREAGDAPAFTARVREADAVILATPMYHGSYAAPLKNAIDYCGFDEFENKTVGLLGVSGGSFPLTALDHLRSVCRALNAWVLPYQAAVPNASRHIEDGAFLDDDLEERVRRLGRRAVEFATIEPDPRCFESEQNVGAD